MSIDIVLPSNHEAEGRLLGVIVHDNSTMSDITDVLKEESFSDRAIQMLFRAAYECYKSQVPINELTLTSALDSNEKSHATERLAEVMANSSITDIGQVGSFVRLVDQAARKRLLTRTALDIVNQACKPGADADTVITEAAKSVLKLATGGNDQRIANGPEAADAALSMFQRRCDAKDGIIGLTTGFPELDRGLAGLQGSKMYTLGGATGMGKTAFGTDITGHVALDLKRPVYYVSLEMDLGQIAEIIAASRARVDLTAATTQAPEAIEAFYDEIEQLHASDLYVDHSDRVSISQIAARARRLHARQPLGLIVVDYLQLADGEVSARENRTQEVTNISRGLKALSRELDVPVLALSQLSREVDKRPDKRPRLGDLRESGSIEQDSDCVLFVYRSAYYHRDDRENHPREKAEVIVAKQRGGPQFDVELMWFEQWASFRPKGYSVPSRKQRAA